MATELREISRFLTPPSGYEKQLKHQYAQHMRKIETKITKKSSLGVHSKHFTIFGNIRYTIIIIKNSLSVMLTCRSILFKVEEK
ncbi:CLUMA_CG003759, isoform A [Clunio marinus]|uniref:CLUMA_CG003759, isoform A n=1 Tax=Clunio marinus TaxID=568069 RepID=A0A1J1HR69_9DIPT|nr:CLUMA_CG003759, isoform A [Clunio marinus]